MRVAFWCLAVVGPAGLVGCTPMAAPASVDAAVAGSDASSATPGLFVDWSTDTVIPGMASTTLRIDRAFFEVQDLRLIGDAGTGSADTTDAQVALVWSATETPPAIAFPSAPPGLYAQVTLDVDGKVDDDSYEFTGGVMIGDDWYDFDVSDHNELAITVPFGFTLAAGAQLDAPLEITLSTALASIDFAKCQTSDGKKVLDSDDEQMPAFRTALKQAFVVAGGEGH